MANQKGTTLLELLVVILISIIALMGMTAPFIAEKSFWAVGKRQAEAQRSGQIVLRSIARHARQSASYTVGAFGNSVTFNYPGCTRVFQLGGDENDALLLEDNCAAAPQTLTLIDGIRSEVTEFLITAISSKLIDFQLEVTEQNREKINLKTQIFLRNA